jgi:hypothetical protein
LTYHCWIAFHKYVQRYAGWKVRRRRSCGGGDDQAQHPAGVAKKRAQYCIDAVYTYSSVQQQQQQQQQQPLVEAAAPADVASAASAAITATASLAGTGSNSNSNSYSHSRNVTAASTGNLQPPGDVTIVFPATAAAAAAASTGNLQPAGDVTTISPATAAAAAAATTTVDDTLVNSSNVATGIKTDKHKPPARTMPTVATAAPPIAAVAATITTEGMTANQSMTPTAAPDGVTTITTTTITTTVTTGHVFRYGDLVSFPVDRHQLTMPTHHCAMPTTRKAIVVRVHPVNEHDASGEDDDREEDKEEDKERENTQQVTVSTGPGERFIVPIHQLVLIQPLSITP